MRKLGLWILLIVTGIPARVNAQTSQTIVFGGIKALAAAAKISGSVSRDSFTQEYCRALVNGIDNPETKNYLDRLHRYSQAVDTLRKQAAVTGDIAVVTLDANSLDRFYSTKDTLRSLGWTLTGQLDDVASLSGISKVAVKPGFGPDDAERQRIAEDLGIDFAEARTALDKNHTFTFRMNVTTVPITLDESFWGKVAGGPPPAGGLLESFIDHPAAARLYVVLNSISPDTRDRLLESIGVDRLASQYSELLVLYGASLSVRNGQVEVPGGKAANPSWEKLVGSSPSQSGAFLGSLLQKDGGKLLAYFHTLSELPMPRQHYFGDSPGRLAAFYTAFPFSQKETVPLEQQRILRRNTQFLDLAREFPLNERGEVVFPGGKTAWSANANETEDQILLNLVSTKQTETFLTLARLQQAWHTPMGRESVQALARNFLKYRSLFPYLLSLPSIDADGLTRFFAAAGAIDASTRLSSDQLDTVLGQFHGVISLIAILSETGGLSGTDGARILSTFCDELTAIQSTNALSVSTAAAAGALRQIVKVVNSTAATADDRLLDGMAGKTQTVSFNLHQKNWSVNRADWQRERMLGVLQAQGITPVTELLALSSDQIERKAADLKTTLIGWSYAYYGAPDDLVIAEDHNFIRRHRFAPEKGHSFWEDTSIRKCPGGKGLCVSGGLSELAIAAGNWGRTKMNAAESLRAEGIPDAAIQTQIAAVRRAPWARMNSEAMHAAALQIRAGRAMIIQGASDSSIRKEIEKGLTSVVGNSRRFAISQALSLGNSAAALDSLSASDLYFLAGGPTAASQFGSVRLRADGPCDEYERQGAKEPLWQCVSPVLLNIADTADHEGIPVDAIPMLAEAVLRQVWSHAQMRDPGDWLSVIRAMNGISLLEVLPELEKSWRN